MKKYIIASFTALLFISCGNNSSNSSNSTEKESDGQIIESSELSFSKTLELQNLNFKVETRGEGSIRKLLVEVTGLEQGDQKLEKEIDGSVVDAQVEDLNSDGFPEIAVFISNSGSGSYGSVIAYSSNANESISEVFMPEISENKEASEKYMGHDEFQIVETKLVRRFKMYNQGDSNANPSGKIKQIQYKLVDGEASRKFEIESITEY